MGPVLAVIAINLGIFVMVMRAIFRAPRHKTGTAKQSEFDQAVEDMKKGAKATFSFFALLGITWVFGALAIGEASLVFVYLFALCNAFQGIFIFVFHCYLDPK